MTADGAYTIPIPGNRLLWLFGDTYAQPDNLDTTTDFPQLPGVWGNTIAVHDLVSPPSTPPTTADTPNNAATGVHFYARSQSISCATGTQCWDNGLCPTNHVCPSSIVNMTWSSPWTTAGWQGLPYFRESCTETTLHTVNSHLRFLWPAHGIYQSSALAVFTWEMDLTGDQNNPFMLSDLYLQKYGGITNTSLPDAWTCTSVTKLPSQYATLPTLDYIQNTDPPLLWGSAVIKPSGSASTYIFGSRGVPGFPHSAPNAKLARVDADADLFDTTKWFVFYDANTNGCGSAPCWVKQYPTTLARRNALHTVASAVGPEFAVDQVTHTETGPNGTYPGTAYVMSTGFCAADLWDDQGHSFVPSGDNWLFNTWLSNCSAMSMRSTTDITHFPAGYSSDVALDAQGQIIGSAVSADIIGFGYTDSLNTVGPIDKDVVSGYNAFRSIHGMKGHSVIADDGLVAYSYWVGGQKRHTDNHTALCTSTDDGNNPAVCGFTDPTLSYTDTTTASTRISNLRFTSIPINRIWPWCQANQLCCILGVNCTPT